MNSSTILVIRHAQSVYNRRVLDAENSAVSEEREAADGIKFLKDPALLDAALSDFGVEQALASRETNMEVLDRVRLVFVTATCRTLETARHLFNTQERRSVRVVVLPTFEQVLGNCDVFCFTAEHMRRFPEFDWSLVRPEVEANGWSWFLHRLTNPAKRESALRLVAPHRANPEAINGAFALVDFMRENGASQLENMEEFVERVTLAKIFVTSALESEKLGSFEAREVALVGHSYFIAAFTASKFDEKSTPMDGLRLANCQVVQFDL